jgi:hypothetical protein
MDVLHDSRVLCDFCGRASVLGWLYQCQQDISTTAQARLQLLTVTDKLTYENMTPIEELEAIGMSGSIIEQIKMAVMNHGRLSFSKPRSNIYKKRLRNSFTKSESLGTHIPVQTPYHIDQNIAPLTLTSVGTQISPCVSVLGRRHCH